MTEVPEPVGASSTLTEVGLAATFGLVSGLFALFVPALAVGLVAVVLSVSVGGWALRRFVRPGGRETALVAAVAAIVVVTAVAPAALAAEVLAGFSALAALVWAAADPRAPTAFRYRTSGLVLPGLALAVAVIVSGVLPASVSLVGVAAGLIIGVVFWIAYVLSRPEPFRVSAES